MLEVEIEESAAILHCDALLGRRLKVTLGISTISNDQLEPGAYRRAQETALPERGLG